MIIRRVDGGAMPVVVDHVTPGGPAAQAGQILPGDRLLAVAGRDVALLHTAAIAALIAGPTGSPVHLRLARPCGGCTGVCEAPAAGYSATPPSAAADSPLQCATVDAAGVAGRHLPQLRAGSEQPSPSHGGAAVAEPPQAAGLAAMVFEVTLVRAAATGAVGPAARPAFSAH